MKVAVLVSGSGTNLQALLDAEARGELGPARIDTVLSNVPGVLALERASRHGVHAACLSHRDFPDRASFDRALTAALRERGAELVVLAGFMRLLGKDLLDAFPDRVVNVHPALSPAFPGAHALRDALAYGARVAGCTVHFVDLGTDTGPILAQEAVPIREGDDEADLRARVQAKEHALLPRAVRAIAEGRVTVTRDGAVRPRVHVAGEGI
jgi:phosphoribosylglycinamide formyltransferase-1